MGDLFDQYRQLLKYSSNLLQQSSNGTTAKIDPTTGKTYEKLLKDSNN